MTSNPTNTVTVHIADPDFGSFDSRAQDLKDWLNMQGEYTPNQSSTDPLHPSVKAVMGHARSYDFYSSLRRAIETYGRLTPRQLEAGLSMMDHFVQSTSPVVVEANQETTTYAFECGFRGQFFVYVTRVSPYRTQYGDGYVNVGETIEGHQLVYMGNSPWVTVEWMEIVATALDHTQYQGIAQTRLSRVKIINRTPT